MSFEQQDALVARRLNHARLYWKRAYDALVENRRAQKKLKAELADAEKREPQLEKDLQTKLEEFQEASEAFMVSGVTLEAAPRPTQES